LIASFILEIKLTNLEQAKDEQRTELEVDLENFMRDNNESIDKTLLS